MRERVRKFHRYMKNHLAQGLLILDETGVVVYANATAAAWLGNEPDGVTGRPHRELWQPPIPTLGPKPGEGQACLCHRDGRSLPVHFTVTPLPLDQGKKRLVSMTNLADVEQFNEALAHTQRLAGIGTMTTSVAHEITNPISVITNTCSNLIHELDNNDLDVQQLRSYIGMIEQSAWRCVNIVEALRNYTHVGDAQIAVTNLNMTAYRSVQ